MVKDAGHITLDELRNRLDELELEKPILVYCAKGLRGYVSSMILAQHGFAKVYNLAGGYAAWTNMHEESNAVLA